MIAGVGPLAAYIIYATGAGGEALAWLGDQFGVLKDTALGYKTPEQFEAEYAQDVAA